MDTLIRDLYASFNARDIEAVLAHLDENVDWPNAWEGGRLHGHEAVRDYWTRQFQAIDGRVEPTQIETHGDQTIVTVHQTVRSRESGELVDDRVVTHTYTIRGGRIVRMEVSEEAG